MDNKPKKLDKILKNDLVDTDKLYAIFDAALIEGLWLNLDHWGLKFLPLYRGEYEKIAEAIPYVIELDVDANKDAYETLLNNVGKNACLLIATPLTIDVLTEKMRFFYHIKTSDGEAALRRFYDPRIFAHFMKGMNGENRVAFFDGVSAYFTEQRQGKELVCFKKVGDELEKNTFSLEEMEQA